MGLELRLPVVSCWLGRRHLLIDSSGICSRAEPLTASFLTSCFALNESGVTNEDGWNIDPRAFQTNRQITHVDRGHGFFPGRLGVRSLAQGCLGGSQSVYSRSYRLLKPAFGFGYDSNFGYFCLAAASDPDAVL